MSGKNIFVFGDSMTYGDEIGATYPASPENASDQVWPNYIDGYHIINHACGGLSNDGILRTMITKANEIKNNKVLVMMTFCNRREYIEDGVMYNFTPQKVFTNITDRFEMNLTDMIDKAKLRQIHEKFINLNNDHDNQITFLKQCIFIQNFLDSIQADYFMSVVENPLLDSVRYHGTAKTYFKALKDTVDWTKIFLVDEKYGFYDHAIRTKQSRLEKGHLETQYHSEFSALFQQKLQQNQWL